MDKLCMFTSGKTHLFYRPIRKQQLLPIIHLHLYKVNSLRLVSCIPSLIPDAMELSLKLFALFLLGTNSLAQPLSPSTYKAAILEHDPRPYAQSPLDTMLSNAKVYAEAAAKASLMGADILAFPEYGIVGLETPPNLGDKAEEFFVYLPTEAVGNWVPCDSPKKYGEGNENHKLLELLSCAALNNSIVLLANLLTKEPCGETSASTCPSSGFYKFNTNIIFNKNGTLLARYHKRHLYGEANLNPAPKNEFEIIDVGFMKFGTFTCFDAMWEDPLIDYVNKHGIRNIIFSTAWVDELPFLTSPQLFNRMARGLAINLMVSNMYLPRRSRLGSGIYSSINGAINETYDLSTPGKLLIAELPLDPPTIVEETMECPLTAKNQSLPKRFDRPFFIQSIVSTEPSSTPSEAIHEFWFMGLKNFSRVFLNFKEDDISLCDGDLCCHISYSFSEQPSQDVYVFAINNGFHPFGIYKMYSQICSVMRCEDDDIETCGRVALKPSSTIFSRLTLSGGFATNTLYPSILATDLQSIPDSQWEFSKGNCLETKDSMKYGGKISLTSAASKPIMVASIYGRDFDRD